MSAKFHALISRVTTFVERAYLNRQFKTYVELAEFAGNYRPNNKYLSQALGVILKEDFEHGKPLRTAAIIRQDTGMPGMGFFELLKELGADLDLEDPAELESFWKAEIQRLGIII